MFISSCPALEMSLQLSINLPCPFYCLHILLLILFSYSSCFLRETPLYPWEPIFVEEPPACSRVPAVTEGLLSWASSYLDAGPTYTALMHLCGWMQSFQTTLKKEKKQGIKDISNYKIVSYIFSYFLHSFFTGDSGIFRFLPYL